MHHVVIIPPGHALENAETDKEIWVVRFDDTISFENDGVKPSESYLFCHDSFGQRDSLENNAIRVLYDPYVCCNNFIFIKHAFYDIHTICMLFNRVVDTMKGFFCQMTLKKT